MTDEKHVDLDKKTLPQLQELLERQNILLKNKKLLERLKDGGESLRKLQENISKEIEYCKEIDKAAVAFSVLNLNVKEKDNEFLKQKHVQYVCSKDKPIKDTRYRPHRTLLHKEIKSLSEKPEKQLLEVTAAFEPKLKHDPVIFVPLQESLVIQNEQALKIMEEQAKRSLNAVYDSSEEDSDDEKHAELAAHDSS